MKKLFTTDTQSGQMTLVFLHYFGGSGRTWQPVIGRLKENYRCITIDFSGFGQSPAPEATASVNENRDAVLQILEDLQLNPFTLIGHSMGGKTALAVAAIQPSGLSNLLLFAPSPPTPEPMTDEDRQTLQAAFGKEEKIRQHLKSIIANIIEPELFETTVSDNLQVSKTAWDGWLQVGSREDISADMQRVQVPITVISGSEDKSLNTAFLQREFNNYFAQVSFIEIQNSGHLLPLENPEEVATIIQKGY